VGVGAASKRALIWNWHVFCRRGCVRESALARERGRHNFCWWRKITYFISAVCHIFEEEEEENREEGRGRREKKEGKREGGEEEETLLPALPLYASLQRSLLLPARHTWGSMLPSVHCFFSVTSTRARCCGVATGDAACVACGATMWRFLSSATAHFAATTRMRLFPASRAWAARIGVRRQAVIGARLRFGDSVSTFTARQQHHRRCSADGRFFIMPPRSVGATSLLWALGGTLGVYRLPGQTSLTRAGASFAAARAARGHHAHQSSGVIRRWRLPARARGQRRYCVRGQTLLRPSGAAPSSVKRRAANAPLFRVGHGSVRR